MAEIPLAINIQGDYGFKVIIVDDQDSIGQVIEKTVEQVVGVLVPPFPKGTRLSARLRANGRSLADTDTVSGLGLDSMMAIDVVVSGRNVD